ncbi:unnamed protein product, partial [Iphiclides podalirius]
MPPKKQLASNKSDSSDNEGTPDAAVEAIVHPLRRRTLCRLSNLYLILRHPLIPRALNRHLSTRVRVRTSLYVLRLRTFRNNRRLLRVRTMRGVPYYSQPLKSLHTTLGEINK